jgi:predicted secreted protein
MNIGQWVDRLHDCRSGRIIFLSHCLLNENTRYLGGACRPAIVREAVEFCLQHGVAIIQLPCPEQCAWGGVLKRRLLRFYGFEGSWWSPVGGVLLPVVTWWTRRVYRVLARHTAAQMSDYVASGMKVVAVVGVDGSPSCGVSKRLDMKSAFHALGRLRPATTTPEAVNNIVRSGQTDGPGLYIDAIRAELDRRGLRVPFIAHDLIAEIAGRHLRLDVTLQSALDRCEQAQ